MSYTLSEFKGENLYLSYTEKQYKGYKYFVTTCYGTANVAFDTKQKLKHWLQNRNLTIGKALELHSLTRLLKGQYCEDFCWSTQELKKIHDEKKGKYFVLLNNGDKTKGVSYVEDGVTHILCCNPNVEDRTVYNWFEKEEESNIA